MGNFEVRLNIYHAPSMCRFSLKIDNPEIVANIQSELMKLKGHLTDNSVQVWLTGGVSVDNKDSKDREQKHES